MLLRLQKFDLTLTYKKGTEMVLADTLSRAYSNSTEQGDTARDTEVIHMIHYLPVSEETQKAVQNATERDDTLRELKSTIRKGWPLTKEEVPVNVRDYFPFRDELTLQNGLVFKGERLVIPTSLRAEMLEKIHASHIGIQGCLRRAREVLYWPGMNKEVEQYIASCETCNSYTKAQVKERLICHELPTRPWQRVATDIFVLEQKEFLITVDYYSSFFEIDRLTSSSSRDVINKLKAHFSRHGIPDTVVSDNGPQFAANEFKQFASLYEFEHVTSSPGYAQSNGKIENAVHTAKNLMQKALDTKQDPYLALLDWRNTPSETLKSSPTQRLFGRRTKTLLPTSRKLLKPEIPDVDERLKIQKSKQSFYYNRGTKELPELKPGDTVRIQPTKLGQKGWQRAQVEDKVDIRSYNVRTEDGRVYRRNRKHLRRTRETEKPFVVELPPDNSSVDERTSTDKLPLTTSPATPKPEQQPLVNESPSASAPPGCLRTRSGRISRPPDRFQ